MDRQAEIPAKGFKKSLYKIASIRYFFRPASSLTRRIVYLNIIALILFGIGVMVLSQFQAGLIDAKIESLRVQGEIIANAVAESATPHRRPLPLDPDILLRRQALEERNDKNKLQDNLEFSINPERAAPVLRRLVQPTENRARLYDKDGYLILDSRFLFPGDPLFSPGVGKRPLGEKNIWQHFWQQVELYLHRLNFPLYEEKTGRSNIFPEIDQALLGKNTSLVRVNSKGSLIISTAIPVFRDGVISGALLLSTEGNDINEIVYGERLKILQILVVALVVSTVLSLLLANTIAGPIRRLSLAADKVRTHIHARETIPDFKNRQDEIGNLAIGLRDMTNALYDRIEAIEGFAADVAHELKNPLTSLQSAVDTLPVAKNDETRERLLNVIKHDVKRIDRLISDIADASRVDAELARFEGNKLDILQLLETLVSIYQEGLSGDIELNLVLPSVTDNIFLVMASEERLSQVFYNIIDNACSFSPPHGKVTITPKKQKNRIIIHIDDQGSGISHEQYERIFERFYTDRVDETSYGNHSGLGLAISRQIIRAHGGEITAQNSMNETGEISGARFTISLPSVL